MFVCHIVRCYLRGIHSTISKGAISFFGVDPCQADIFLIVGMLSAAASLGVVLLWDVDGGLTQIDKYLYSSEDYIKVSLDTAHSWGPSLLMFWYLLLIDELA